MHNYPAYICGDLFEKHGDFIHAFLRYAKIREYHKGDVILRQDDMAKGLYLLLEGILECFFVSESGQKKTICVHTGRWIFGTSSLEGYKHTLNYSCLIKVKVAFMPVAHLKHWDKNMLLTLAICQTYKIRFYNRQIQEQAYRSIDDRIIRVLYEWATVQGKYSENGNPLALGMKQQMIGDLLGITRVQVSRIISRLVQEGKIRFVDKGMEICCEVDEGEYSDAGK